MNNGGNSISQVSLRRGGDLGVFLFAIAAWSLLILRFGYQFGTGDQVELLPYTLYLHDHSLYAKDFFIQGLNASVPNERTVMAYLLLPFVNHLEIFCFIFQLLSTVVLVIGLEKIAVIFIHNKYLAWLSVLISLILLNNYTLGDVDLYSACVQASSVATAIVVWGIYYFLHRRYTLSSVLLSIAGIIQVLEGLDVMLVLSALLLLMLFIGEASRRQFLTFICIYGFTAGLFILWIFIGKQERSPITNEQLFQILFRFRHPHHFILTTFPLFKMIVFFLLTLIGLIYFSRHSSKVFEFMLAGMFGVIFYAFAVDDFHNVFIGNFQFYKVAQWMKFFAVIGTCCLAEEYFLTRWHQLSFRWDKFALIVLIAVCWVVILKFNERLPYKVPFQLFSMKEKDDMIDICEKIKGATPKDALFMQPFDNTELKYYGERSSFVEFKANVRNKKFVNEWYHRIQIVYGLSLNDNQTGFAMRDKADAIYYTSNKWELNSRVDFGITHMLVDKRYKPPFGRLILENNSYAVYQF